jgi:DNA polymerase-3 subunit alpha
MLDETVEAAVKWRKEREDLQIQLFGFVEVNNWSIEYPDIRPYTTTQQLEFERELLGLYISGHPLDDQEELLSSLELDRFVDLTEAPDESEVTVAGMVVSVKPISTKKGQMMGFMELEDRVDRTEVVLFPKTWERYNGLVEKGALLVVRAKLQQQDEDFKLLADDIAPLEAGAVQALLRRRKPQPQPRREPPARPAGGSTAPRAGASAGAAQAPSAAPPSRPAAGGASVRNTRAGQRVYIKISADRETALVLEQLKSLLQEHGGPMQTVLFYEREQKAIALSEGFNIKPSPVLFRQVEALLGPETMKVK